jgi:hypothetical protein
MRKLLLILTAIILLSCVEPTNDFGNSQWERETQTEQPESQPINQPAQQQPQTENNNQQEQQEQTEPQIQPQPTQPAEEFNYLLTNKHPNLNSYHYLTSSFNQGEWENGNEKFEFYNGSFFKYWKNKNDSVPTYQGIVKIYSTTIISGEETQYFFHGTQNNALVIWCETTINNNGYGSIKIGGKEFINLNIIEESEIEQPPENYLNIASNLSNYGSQLSFNNESIMGDNMFIGTYENKYGEVFEFSWQANTKKFKFWDSSHRGGERNNSNRTYKAPPTMEGFIYTYNVVGKVEPKLLACADNGGGLSNTTPLQIFTTYEFKSVFSNINGFDKDLYLNGIQFVRRGLNKPPVFID